MEANDCGADRPCGHRQFCEAAPTKDDGQETRIPIRCAECGELMAERVIGHVGPMRSDAIHYTNEGYRACVANPRLTLFP